MGLVRYGFELVFDIYELEKLLSQHVDLILHFIPDELLICKHLLKLFDFVLSCMVLRFSCSIEVRYHVLLGWIRLLLIFLLAHNIWKSSNNCILWVEHSNLPHMLEFFSA